MLLKYASFMARHPQSGNKTLRVADVISDHGSSFGRLLRKATLLMQLEHLLAGFLDPGLAAHFQAAALRGGRLVLISPSGSWATRLRLQVPQLLDSLHRAGYAEIEVIDVRVAPLVRQPAGSRTKKPLSPAAREALRLMARLDADGEE